MNRRLPTFWQSPRACAWKAGFPGGGSLSELWRPAVPLSSFQLRVLRLLAALPLVPNAETVEAMKAARRGDLVTAGKPSNLLASLNADC